MEVLLSFLDNIRSDLVDESAAIANTLRKAKILASAIGLPEFREWIDFELGGYSDWESVPSYRRFPATNLGTFGGPFGSAMRNVVLPTVDLPDTIKEFAENLIIFDGVGALQAQDSKSTHRKWPQELLILARNHIQMSGGMVLVDAHQPVPAYIVSGILDQVKNKLLDFVLGLQESNITPEDLDSRKVESDVVRNLYNIHIYGDRNVVASGEHVEQRVTQVQEGDVDSLLNYLRGLNIDDRDLTELKKAVASEPTATGGDYGPKVQAWLGGMISKAASRSWDIGLDAASKLLTDALKGYYG